MYAEQPMIMTDYPSVLQAVNVEKWEGWQPYAGGSVWNNSLDRQSYLELKPNVTVAEAATSEGSSTTLWAVVGGVIVFVAIVVLVVLIRRSRGRAVEE